MQNGNIPMLGGQHQVTTIDPAAIAAAEAVKANRQAGYMMAIHRPRNVEQSRVRILEACKRPQFAERVEYAKPVGKDKFLRGPSIRFAELAVREWGNVNVDTQVVYEDENVRRIKVTVLDYETNAAFGKDIQVTKTVERQSSQGREVISQRTNSYGKTVYIVKATDDELSTKESAQISKVIRNEGLRLIPQDIIEEAMVVAKQTLASHDSEDPQAGKRRIIDYFSGIGVHPKELEKYLGHSLDILAQFEIEELRAIATTIKTGEASWFDYVKQSEDDKPNAADSLNSKLKSKQKSQEETIVDVVPSTNAITDNQRKWLQTSYSAFSREARLEDVSSRLGRTVSSFNELTFDEASILIEQIQNGESVGA